MGRFSTVVLKIVALLSFCGGPLLASDALQPVLGDPWGFVVAFVPVALMLLGAFGITDPERDTMSRLSAWAGAAGAIAVGLVNVWGVTRLVAEPERADRGLVVFGTIVGFTAVVLYAGWFARWVRVPAPSA